MKAMKFIDKKIKSLLSKRKYLNLTRAAKVNGVHAFGEWMKENRDKEIISITPFYCINKGPEVNKGQYEFVIIYSHKIRVK